MKTDCQHHRHSKISRGTCQARGFRHALIPVLPERVDDLRRVAQNAPDLAISDNGRGLAIAANAAAALGAKRQLAWPKPGIFPSSCSAKLLKDFEPCHTTSTLRS